MNNFCLKVYFFKKQHNILYLMYKYLMGYIMASDTRKNAVVECPLLRIKQIYTQIFKSEF